MNKARLAGLIGLLLILWTHTAGRAQQAAPEITALTVATVESRITATEQDTTLAEGVKTRALELFRQALDDLKRTDTWNSKRAEFDAAREQAPASLAQIKSELAKPAAEAPPTVPQDATVATVEQSFAQSDADLKAARNAATALDDERKRRTDRRAELPGLITATRVKLDEVSREVAAFAPSGENPALNDAQRTALTARRSALLAEAQAYEAEVSSYDARSELLTARRDLAARRVTSAEAVAKFWQETLNTKRREEADRAAREAAKARREAVRSSSALEELASENAKLADERTALRLPDRIEQVTALQDAITKETTKITNDFASATAKLRAAGLNPTMGVLLRRERDKLPNLRAHQDAVEQRQAEVSRVQIELINLEDRRSNLSVEAPHLIEAVARKITDKPEEERKEILDLAQELVQTRRNYIDSLISDYNSYFAKLGEVDSAERQLVAKIEEVRAYIDERVLWIQSTTWPQRGDVEHAVEAAGWLVDGANWRSAATSFWATIRSKPIHVLLLLPIVIALAATRARLWRQVQRLGEEAARPVARELAPTVRAIVLTAGAALLYPSMLWTLGWTLTSHTGGTAFANALGYGLRDGAGVLLMIEVLRHVCRPYGLGESHFSWPLSITRRLRRHLAWLALLGIPVVVVVSTLERSDNDAWTNSLGRGIFILGQVLLLVFTQAVLRSRGARQAEGGASTPAWRSRFRIVWYVLGIGLPLVFGVLAAAGFYYTVLRLTTELIDSLWLVVGLVLANALILRWILINRRRISMEEYRKRRAAMQASEAGQEAPPEPRIDLSSISTQVHNLLRLASVFVFVLGLWGVWNDVLPALRILDRVELWTVMERVEEAVVDAQGQATTHWVERPGPVTLQDLGIALVIFGVTLVASRNLPGLLEFLLLQRLRLQTGERYAITSVSRYAVVGVGIVLGFGAIGLGWSKVQWLAAAVTVGLGFGLQEIFANFVSGIIILFERPIRIGDVVTVGEIEGNVTRIQIRATTITDWNMRELIVPNKEFITGRLINWTLSDQTTRLVIPVGIAYGSDTQRATDLLLSVARADAHVLDDPAPNVVFRAFGSSSLDFELRVYIATREVWPKVTHGLHMAIDQEFRKAGIEIAFPQRDLHIRSIDVPIRIDDERGAK